MCAFLHSHRLGPGHHHLLLRLVVQFSSVQSLSRGRLCDVMDCSTPGLPVHHQLPEFTQTHVHWVGDAIQPSHPLSSPSPPAFNLSQRQGLVVHLTPCLTFNSLYSIYTQIGIFKCQLDFSYVSHFKSPKGLLLELALSSSPCLEESIIRKICLPLSALCYSL